jgi:phage repressor protein C with HTH and peptisase S24 domain
MDTIVERLRKYLDFTSVSVSNAEKLLNLSNGTLSKPFKSKTTIKTDTLEKFLNHFIDISPEWLITGNGEMLRESIDESRNMTVQSAIKEVFGSNEMDKKSNVLVATNSHNQGIPLIPLDAMAGYAQGSSQILELDCERFIVPTFKGADYLITVKGSSMNPKYNSGDIVACKNLPLSDIFFQWNKVYVIDTIQGPLIKRVEPGSDDTHIQLISDNPKYKPFNLKISEINAIALVIGVIRLE